MQSTSLVNEIIDLVVDAVRQTGDNQGLEVPHHLGAATALFGGSGLVDSMGLVTLVVIVEQLLADRYQVAVSLANDRALSREHSPYRTVESLASYAAELVAEQQDSAQ